MTPGGVVILASEFNRLRARIIYNEYKLELLRVNLYMCQE